MGPLAAIGATVFSTRASSAPVSQTNSRKPQRRAWPASTVSPVSSSQWVGPWPISAGNNTAWITDGMPTRTSGMPKTASSLARRMSQAAASSMPAPRQKPGMRAIVGTGISATASHRSRRRVMNARAPCGSSSAIS